MKHVAMNPNAPEILRTFRFSSSLYCISIIIVRLCLEYLNNKKQRIAKNSISEFKLTNCKLYLQIIINFIILFE